MPPVQLSLVQGLPSSGTSVSLGACWSTPFMQTGARQSFGVSGPSGAGPSATATWTHFACAVSHESAVQGFTSAHASLAMQSIVPAPVDVTVPDPPALVAVELPLLVTVEPPAPPT